MKENLEFEFKGTVFVYDDLTVRQVEIVSDALHEARLKIIKEIEDQVGVGDIKPQEYVVKVSDMIHELRRAGKTSLFVSACVHQKGHSWSEEAHRQNIALFKDLPYKQAEKVMYFFLNGGDFQRILIPSFLAQAQPANPGTGKRKS